MATFRHFLRIDFESEAFPAGASVRNGVSQLDTSWDELLWAAVTVGRPNRHYVFRHGDASRYEALFRWLLIRMALEQSSPAAYRLRRTEAARTLDPSEKGAINYFVGMTLCKLFAARYLDAPWVMHLDVFRPLLDPVLKGRSRPDLVAQNGSGDWIALESKGRISKPSRSDKDKAKAQAQAQRLIRVNGSSPVLNVGCITYLRRDVLRFFWRDPETGKGGKTIEDLPFDDEAWRYYYLPVLELIRSQAHIFQRMLREAVLLPIESLDIEVGIYPPVLKLLADRRWGEAKRWVTTTEVNGQMKATKRTEFEWWLASLGFRPS